jgi:hypothetical protein
VNLLKGVFDIIAGLAGIAGLIFSISASMRAGRAEKAAEAARRAVRRGNASEDLRQLATKAKELLNSLQNNQFESARLRGGDLILEITQASRRWQGFLPDDSQGQIREAGNKVGQVTRALGPAGQAIGPEDALKLVNTCHQILTRLAAESGNIQYSVEEGERKDASAN